MIDTTQLIDCYLNTLSMFKEGELPFQLVRGAIRSVRLVNWPIFP